MTSGNVYYFLCKYVIYSFRFVQHNMGEVRVMICHSGMWVISDNERENVGGEENRVVSKSI